MKSIVPSGVPVVAASLFFTFFSVVHSVGQSDEAQRSVDARMLYDKHCARCHGSDGRAKTFRGFLTGAHNLANPKWQEIVTDEEIINALKKGPGPMPSFEKQFSPAEFEALVVFVRGLKARSQTSQEHEHP